MEVTLRVKTTKCPEPQIYIQANINVNSVSKMDEMIKTLRLARNWLATAKGQAKTKTAPS